MSLSGVPAPCILPVFVPAAPRPLGAAVTETASALTEGGSWLSDQLLHFADGGVEFPTGHPICPQPPPGLGWLLSLNGELAELQ